MKTQHFIAKIKRLILFTGIIAVYTDNHAKRINTLHGQNGDLLIVNTGDTNSYHSTIKIIFKIYLRQMIRSDLSPEICLGT
jgi:hypothetical protein